MKDSNETNFDASVLRKRTIDTSDTVVPFAPEILRKANPIIKVELSWKGDADLDISAFMLDEKGCLRQDYNNLVYYNSDPWRWKTERPIDTNDFNPLKGEVAKWPECANKFMSNDDWFFSTLPLSVDESVIGSWDDKGGNVDGGDEKLHVRLNKINTKFYRSIAIVASIHQGDEGGKRLTFSEISNPCVNIFDADTKEHDIEYRLNNDDNSEFECVIVGYVKFNDVTRKWDYVTANKGFESFESAIKHHW